MIYTLENKEVVCLREMAICNCNLPKYKKNNYDPIKSDHGYKKLINNIAPNFKII